MFINHVATPENTRVETDANAIVRMQPLLRTKDWKEEKIGYASTARLYHGMQRWLAGFETLTRLAFHASWIAAMVIGILHFHWLAAGVAFSFVPVPFHHAGSHCQQDCPRPGRTAQILLHTTGFRPIAADTVFTLEMVLSVPQEKRFSEKVILLFVTDGSCRMDACNQE